MISQCDANRSFEADDTERGFEEAAGFGRGGVRRVVGGEVLSVPSSTLSRRARTSSWLPSGGFMR